MNAQTVDGLRLNDQVTLHYRIRCLEQEVASTHETGPETFRLGQGEIDPRLELCLTGLRKGEHRLFQLAPWQAFGERHEELVQTLPRSDFPAGMELAVDHLVDFELPNGEAVQGRILALDADSVQLDFNHPLAGLPVEFEVEILDIAKRDSHAD
jgi:FKBP-type peptidyl-prolyl cis-trans isomerase SlpA